MIYLLAMLLAFCSVCYELLLGQILSAFLGNTVLRYSVTIGLYMASMGIGAFLVRARIKEFPLISLALVEIGLCAIGAGAIPFLFVLDNFGAPLGVFSLFAHSFIIIIGVLTGMEIPLLVELRRKEKAGEEGVVIGVDYFGAFIGTFVFAFYFYPSAGLVASAFALATMNALAGIMLIMLEDRVAKNQGKVFSRLIALQGVLFLAVAYCWSDASRITAVLLQLYLPTT